MALFDNRLQTSQSARLYKKASSLLHKNMLLGLIVLSFSIMQIVKHNTYSSNDLLLEVAGKLYSATNKVVTYFEENFKDIAKYFALRQSLDSENKRLQQEIVSLNAKAANFELMQIHDLELKRLLNFVSLMEVDYVSARMLSIIYSAEGAYGLIDCGKNSGLSIGDMVVADGGVIGKITQVSNSYAKILLIANSRFRMPVLTSSGQKGILVGDKLRPYLLYLENTSEIKQQDLVVTLGDHDSLIADIPIAKVSSIEDRVYLKFISNLKNVNFVSILRVKRDELYD
jgi:rod shape-determining protein MreC